MAEFVRLLGLFNILIIELFHHQLNDDWKFYRFEFCKNIIKQLQRDENFLKSIINGNKTSFKYFPETK